MIARLHQALSPTMIRVVQILVFAGLMLLLWNAADGQAALARLRSADPGWLITAGALLTVQTILSAQRWRITAAQLGLKIPFAEAVREYYLAQVVNQSLPGGFVGDAARAVRARKDAGLLVSGQAVVFERLAGQMGLAAVLVFGLSVAGVFPIGLDWPHWLVLPLATTLCVLILGPLAVGLVVRGMLAHEHPIRKNLHAFAHAVFAKPVRGQQVVLSLATALCNVLAFAACAASIGVFLLPMVAAALVPLILFAMVVPISVSGWGLREGAAALLFPLAGAAANEGLAASVAFGLVFLLTVAPGLLLLWLRPNAPVPEQ